MMHVCVWGKGLQWGLSQEAVGPFVVVSECSSRRAGFPVSICNACAGNLFGLFDVKKKTSHVFPIDRVFISKG